MASNVDIQLLESALFQSTGIPQAVKSAQHLSGGCINNAVKTVTNEGTYFIKFNDNIDEDMFEKEALGLSLLKAANHLQIPDVIGIGQVGPNHYIILEHINKAAPSADFWEDFGQNLAKLHRQTAPTFGLDHNNYIGKLPQRNDQEPGWLDFFIQHRLEVQLGLALYNDHIDEAFANRFRQIYPILPGIIPEEPPAMLHGDLWSGNFMVGPGGKACLFDPAVYYGHREIELAFTKLFGGFDPAFYHGYHEQYPVEPGFDQRMDIYNLYPLLVHVNLFGTSYLTGVEATLRRFL
ncbi:fructosamine kinase family protein [Marinoscillum furvescens]|uniref:Fructosamine-3-kinase n=1 Tax=Marinoscillum furvescens DSM 4134 TaxID=1122208 RepID=A0A3D9LGD4_MARFU|nr:fructosamine kinase family protein [Marinoscillum furvescens]REE05740.1 fructosamine-3-kinase [Marinoscillum furvescens DSM 4134]